MGPIARGAFFRGPSAVSQSVLRGTIWGSAKSPLHGSLAELLHTLQPQLERMKITTAQTIAMDGLESRLRDAVIERAG
jgi:hypothetical protein